jgi:hypothetical protein
MIFKKHLHFAIYHDDYNFFINILFNHLISISKWELFRKSFFLVLNYLILSTICKKPFLILAWYKF